MHLNDAIGRCKRPVVRLRAPRAGRGDGGTGLLPAHQPAGRGQRDRRARAPPTRSPACSAPGPTRSAWSSISGQVKWETLVRSTTLPLRQLGDQEVDIIRLVEPITKYAVLVTDPEDDPLSPRARDPPGADRAARAGVARHSGQRAVGDGRSRYARGLHCRTGRTRTGRCRTPRASRSSAGSRRPSGR